MLKNKITRKDEEEQKDTKDTKMTRVFWLVNNQVREKGESGAFLAKKSNSVKETCKVVSTLVHVVGLINQVLIHGVMRDKNLSRHFFGLF